MAAAASAPATQTMALGENGQPLFTCLSCNVAFPNAPDQRTHYRTDWHRYNAKRRVAQLPPIRQDVFQQKVVAASTTTPSTTSTPAQSEGSAAISQAQQSADSTAEPSSSSSSSNRCAVCNKSFASNNVLKDHLQSKKHKDQALQASLKQAQQIHTDDHKPAPVEPTTSMDTSTPPTTPAPAASSSTAPTDRPTHTPPMTLNVPDNATEEEINALIDAKLASATRIDPTTHCLFCPQTTPTLDQTLLHMSKTHGFFLPEREYLIDLPGLMTYLADKITVGNICLYCNARGRSFASLEAVRGHMVDKSHCKLAYTEEADVLELSDFYDFSSSYPDEEDAEWEDADGDGEEDVDMEEDGAEEDGQEKSTRPRPAKRGNVAHYGDTEYELVLPSGVRLGHRALRRYYNQTVWSTPATLAQDAELARRQQRLITATENGIDPKNALVVMGRGGKQNAVLAKSRGQAKEANRHINEFRDMRRREAYKTRVAYTNNNQKHFRDPLLQ
ncbi:hypothetical protein CF319_g1984 [Tilletia indica]|nr:hypothetical protein CF319_g1984 [Tilletia indica]